MAREGFSSRSTGRMRSWYLISRIIDDKVVLFKAAKFVIIGYKSKRIWRKCSWEHSRNCLLVYICSEEWKQLSKQCCLPQSWLSLFISSPETGCESSRYLSFSPTLMKNYWHLGFNLYPSGSWYSVKAGQFLRVRESVGQSWASELERGMRK